MIYSDPRYFINARWGGDVYVLQTKPQPYLQKKIIQIISNGEIAELEQLQQEQPHIQSLFCIQIDSINLYKKEFERISPFGFAILQNKWDFIYYILPQLTPPELDAPCSTQGAPLATLLFANKYSKEERFLKKIMRVATALLKAGAHPNLTTFSPGSSHLEYSPLVMAVNEYRYSPLIELLIAHGAKRPYYFESLTRDILRQALKSNSELYKKAKAAVKIHEKCKTLFYCARNDALSLPGKLPKELHFYIFSFFSYIPHSQALISNQKARILWQEKNYAHKAIQVK